MLETGAHFEFIIAAYLLVFLSVGLLSFYIFISYKKYKNAAAKLEAIRIEHQQKTPNKNDDGGA